MRIYTCAPQWEAMLTAIYEASASGIGHTAIRLATEPIEQFTLFDEYIHVDADPAKASKVIDAVNLKISPTFYSYMVETAMAYESDALDNIYHMLILGFAYGPDVMDNYQYVDVVRNHEIRCRVVREADKFREFLRFHQIGNVYIAHFEPKSRVAEYLASVFQDRMPSENFVIVDDVHLEMVIHRADEPYYLSYLSELELQQMKKSEDINDSFTDLWKVFFDTIAIKERVNPRCQRNFAPLWLREHMVEFK